MNSVQHIHIRKRHSCSSMRATVSGMMGGTQGQRPTGVSYTFGGSVVMTPYVAPKSVSGDQGYAPHMFIGVEDSE